MLNPVKINIYSKIVVSFFISLLSFFKEISRFMTLSCYVGAPLGTSEAREFDTKFSTNVVTVEAAQTSYLIHFSF